MADTTIHALTDGTSPADSDEFIVVRSPYGVGDDRKLTWLELSDALSLVFQPLFRVNVEDYGAVGDVATLGSGGTDDTSAINAAIAALPTVGGYPRGTLYFPAAIYRVDGDIDEIGPYVSIESDGPEASILDYRGSGTCLSVHAPSDFSDPPQIYGGRIRVGIYGGSASAGAVGLDLGDIVETELDVIIQDFYGSGSVCLNLHNKWFWTERLRGRAIVLGTTGVALTCDTGATNSFAYWDGFSVSALGCVYPVVLKAGAYLASGSFRISGYCDKVAASDGAVITVTGTHPDSGGYSGIENMDLDVQIEQSNDELDGTNVLQTIKFGAAGNYLRGSHGTIAFTDEAFTASNAFTIGAPFSYVGILKGDANLNPNDDEVPVAVGGFNVVPGWQDFTPSPTGFTTPTVDLARYRVVGGIVYCQVAIEGSSNSTTKSFSLPVPAASGIVAIYAVVDRCQVGTGYADNDTPGMVAFDGSNNDSILVYPDGQQGDWPTGDSGCYYQTQFFYEAA